MTDDSGALRVEHSWTKGEGTGTAVAAGMGVRDRGRYSWIIAG